MSNHVSEPSPQRAAESAQSALAVGVGVGACYLLVSLLAGSDLLDRQMWMDEVHTWLIVSDPDLGHAMNALSHGADYNPPMYYLLLRGFTSITGVTAASMRAFSLLSMCIGLGCIAAILRRRVSAKAAMCGAAAIAIQPLIIQQATEARFYSVWFALVAAFCLAKSSSSRTLGRLLTQSVLAAMICTVHYFGVISLGLVFLVDAANAWRNRNEEQRRAALFLRFTPYAAGVLALLGCLGFYFGQRAALSEPTWISAPTLPKVKGFLTEFLPVIPLALAAFGWLLSGGLAKQVQATEPEEPAAAEPTTPWNLLLAGIGMPITLIVFSYVVQPALVARYAIVAMLAWGPLIAALLRRAESRFAFTFLAVCLILGVDNIRDLTWMHEGIQAERDRLTQVLQERSAPVIFEDRIDHYPAAMSNPSSDWFMIDFEQRPSVKPALRIVQRDAGRAVAEFYPQLALSSMQRLVDQGHNSFLVVPYKSSLTDHESAADEARLATEYPNFEIERVERRVYRFRWLGGSIATAPQL